MVGLVLAFGFLDDASERPLCFDRFSLLGEHVDGVRAGLGGVLVERKGSSAKYR